MVEVKATELLAKISTDMTQVKEMLKLQGYQYTLILKKLNELGTTSKVEPPQAPSIPVNIGGSVKALEKTPIGGFSVPVESKVAPESPKEKIFQTTIQVDRDARRNRKPIKNEPATIEEEQAYNFNTTENAEQEGVKQKVPVTQIVYTSTGKPVSIAMVELKNESGEVLQKIKTNSVGRWSALVDPGKYIVHLTRRYDTETINYEQVFEVSAGTKQIEIPAPEAYRRKPSRLK